MVVRADVGVAVFHALILRLTLETRKPASLTAPQNVPTLTLFDTKAALKAWYRLDSRKMFEKYTDEARRVIFYAREQAKNQSQFIEVSHLVLGILQESTRVIQEVGVSPEALRGAMESLCHRSREGVSTHVDLPLSGPVKRVLAYAAEEAALLRHKNLMPKDLLLGVLRDNGPEARALVDLGATLVTAREIFRLPSTERAVTYAVEYRVEHPALDFKSVSDFSDSYWRCALNSDGKTWPFAKLHPCVPGFANQSRDAKIMKARRRYAPYDLAEERPLIIADVFFFGSGGLLVTDKRIYTKDCKQHPVELANGVGLEIGRASKYQLTFANGSQATIDGQLDAAVLADFLCHLLQGNLSVKAEEIQSLIDPSLGNSFVASLKRMRASHAAQLAVSRNPVYAGEQVVGGFEGIILTNRRIVGYNGEHALLEQGVTLRIDAEYSSPAHVHSLHSHGHPLLNLLSKPVAKWANDYNKKNHVPIAILYNFRIWSNDPASDLKLSGSCSKSHEQELIAFRNAAGQLGVEVIWNV